MESGAGIRRPRPSQAAPALRAAAFRGRRPARPATLRRRASIRSTTFSAAGSGAAPRRPLRGEQLLQRAAIGVGMPRRVPAVAREPVHELFRERDFGGSRGRRRQAPPGGVAHLLEGTQRDERQGPAAGRQRGQVRPGAQRDAHDSRPAPLGERAPQESVGLLASLSGHDVVGLVEREKVDRVRRNELEDLDGAPAVGRRGLFRRPLEIFLLDDGPLRLAVPSAAHDLVVAHLDVLETAELLVVDGRQVLAVEQVKGDSLRRFDGARERDRDRDQPERDLPRPDRPRRGGGAR